MATYEDFKKLEIKVAEIESVAPHPNADRLYVLGVKVGGVKKTLVAGIRADYSDEELKGKKIVIIDDCRLTLTMARDILADAGYEVLTAESGIEANQHIYANPPPDLIMIDVVMPMLQGDRKVKLLKDRAASSKIPVLLISSKSNEELELLVRQSGADGFMQKPLRPQTLLATVQQWTL